MARQRGRRALGGSTACEKSERAGHWVGGEAWRRAGCSQAACACASERPPPDLPLTNLPLTGLPLTNLPLTGLPLTGLPFTAFHCLSLSFTAFHHLSRPFTVPLTRHPPARSPPRLQLPRFGRTRGASSNSFLAQEAEQEGTAWLRCAQGWKKERKNTPLGVD